LRLSVQDMRWRWDDEVLEIGFSLVAGAYATAVLREIVQS
jgi:tRNA(Glu) U13 pseudouridine synthase TruD